jgi:hypothetical protein
MDSQTLLVFAFAALVAGAVLQLWLAVAGYRARPHSPEADVALLAQEVKALRFVVTRRTKNAAAAPRATPTPAPAQSAPLPASDYRDAVARIQHGAGVKELTTACGLSRGEAELLVRVYGDTQVARHAFAAGDTL